MEHLDVLKLVYFITTTWVSRPDILSLNGQRLYVDICRPTEEGDTRMAPVVYHILSHYPSHSLVSPTNLNVSDLK